MPGSAFAENDPQCCSVRRFQRVWGGGGSHVPAEPRPQGRGIALAEARRRQSATFNGVCQEVGALQHVPGPQPHFHAPSAEYLLDFSQR